ncbi:excisionase family protein, partial [Citrobacter freundii]
MSNIFQLAPNEWVCESVLIAVTGLKPGTILRARKECWMVGREYIHVSPDGNPKPSSECMYNRKAVDAWCSGQLKLATALEFFQYRFSDSFGGN